MKLQKQPNNWSCVPTAFAMVLDIPVEEIILKIGHDGSRITYPTYPEPNCRLGFSPHELFTVCLELGYACTPIMKEYPLGIDDGVPVVRAPFIMDELMRTYSGVLCGLTPRENRHAVAWDRSMIFDPAGIKYFKEDFDVEVFFIVTQQSLLRGSKR